MAWTQQEKEDFGKMVMAAGDMMRQPMTPAGQALFTRLVESEIDFRTACKALNMHLLDTDKGGTFLPKPADLIRLVKGTKEDAAQVAWAKVDAAVRRVGTYQSVVFDDPIIHVVIADMGGWPVLGEKQEDEWPFMANEFRQRYHAIASRGADRLDHPPKLLGTDELNNGAYDEHWYLERGLPIPVPVLIGDQGKSQQVLLQGSTTTRLRMERLGDITAQMALPEPAMNAA